MIHVYNSQYLRSWGRIFEFKTSPGYIMKPHLKRCTKTNYKDNFYKLIEFLYINHKLETILIIILPSTIEQKDWNT